MGDQPEIPLEAMRPPHLEGEALQSPLTVRDGESCQVTVKVSGIPIPDITWFHGSREIKNCPEFRVDDKGTSCTLYISSVTEELSNRGFTVKAVNRVGVQQHSINIKVYKVHTKWRNLIKSESFATRSPDNIIRSKRRKLRKVHAGISMTSLRHSNPPRKPPRSMSVGERDWSYAHASHSTDSIIDDVFSFDRKSAFATSTPRDGPVYGTQQNGIQQTLLQRSNTTGAVSTKRHPDTMTDSGFSEEDIFRFRCSESDFKLVQVNKAPPLALPEDFDDDAFESPLCSPKLEEKILTPKSSESGKDMVDCSTEKRDKDVDWLVKEGNRFKANAQLWISDKKTHQTQSANAVNSADVTDVPDFRYIGANQQRWPSEEKKRRSSGTALEQRTIGAKQENIKNEIHQNRIAPVLSGISPAGNISTVIRRSNLESKNARPYSETNLDDYYHGYLHPYTSRKGEVKEERILEKKISTTQTTCLTRPASALRRSPPQNNRIVKNTSDRVTENSKIFESVTEEKTLTTSKHSPIISRKSWKDSSIPRLSQQGKLDINRLEKDKNRPRSSSEPVVVHQVQTKADIHMSMEGPSHCPGLKKEQQTEEDKLKSSKVLDNLDKALSLQEKIEQDRSAYTVSGVSPTLKRRSGSDGQLNWVYPRQDIKPRKIYINTDQEKYVESKETLPVDYQLPCVKILDDAISMIYAEASSLFGEDTSLLNDNYDSHSKEKEESSIYESKMYEYPRMSLLDAPLPRLSEVSDEGSVASYRAAKGSSLFEPASLQIEEVFSDDSIENGEAPDILNGINTNTNNHHDVSLIGPQDYSDSIQLEEFPVESMQAESKANNRSAFDDMPHQLMNPSIEEESKPGMDTLPCEGEIIKHEELNNEATHDQKEGEVEDEVDVVGHVEMMEEKNLSKRQEDDDNEEKDEEETGERDDKEEREEREQVEGKKEGREGQYAFDNEDNDEEKEHGQITSMVKNEESWDDDDSVDTESVDTVIELPSSIESESDIEDSIELYNFAASLVEKTMKTALDMIETLPKEAKTEIKKTVDSVDYGLVPDTETIEAEQEHGFQDSNQDICLTQDQIEGLNAWTNGIINDAISIVVNSRECRKMSGSFGENSKMNEKDDGKERDIVSEEHSDVEMDTLSNNKEVNISEESAMSIHVEDINTEGNRSLGTECENEIEEIYVPTNVTVNHRTSNSSPEMNKNYSPEIMEGIETWISGILANAASIVKGQSSRDNPDGVKHAEDMRPEEKDDSDIDLDYVRLYVDSVIKSAVERYDEEERMYDEAIIQVLLEEEGYGFLQRPGSLSSISEEGSISEESDVYMDESFQIDNISSTRVPLKLAEEQLLVTETFSQIDLPQSIEVVTVDDDTLKEELPSKSDDQTSIHIQDYSGSDIHHFKENKQIQPQKSIGNESFFKEESLDVPLSVENTSLSLSEDNSIDLSWDNDMGPKLTFNTGDNIFPPSSAEDLNLEPEEYKGKLTDNYVEEVVKDELYDQPPHTDFDGKQARQGLIIPTEKEENVSIASSVFKEEPPSIQALALSGKLEPTLKDLGIALEASSEKETDPNLTHEYSEYKGTPEVHVVSSLESLRRELLECNWGAVLFLLLAVIIMCIISWWSSADE